MFNEQNVHDPTDETCTKLLVRSIETDCFDRPARLRLSFLQQVSTAKPSRVDRLQEIVLSISMSKAASRIRALPVR